MSTSVYERVTNYNESMLRQMHIRKVLAKHQEHQEMDLIEYQKRSQV
jgi:hypothetical protein